MWSDAINVHLWPYALRKASEDINQISHPNVPEYPLHMISRVAVHDNITNNYTFGCPVYVLQRPLRSGSKIPKWDPRATMGIYLGRSQIHESSVGIVLSLRTGLVSPSFHNKYYDSFVTVADSSRKYIPKSNWQSKYGFRVDLTDPLLLLTSNVSEGVTGQGHNNDHQQDLHHQEPPNDVENEIPIQYDDEGAPAPNDIYNHPEGDVLDQHRHHERIPGEVTTRSGRVSRMPQRYPDYVMYNVISLHEPSDEEEAYSASSDPDTMYYHDILREPDKDRFVEAMIKEIQQHKERDNWKVVPRNQIPSHNKILPSVWAMRRKRDLTTG
jgi:hypothetical protein